MPSFISRTISGRDCSDKRIAPAATVIGEFVKISGFSFVRNGDTFGYPVAEAIRSIVPISDEFDIAVGESDAKDNTRRIIDSIGDPKIRIIDTRWDRADAPGSLIYSRQTNVALNACSGDWCFYIQCDEVVHERYLSAIVNSCEKWNDNTRVEGLLLGYKHFWGDYDHYQDSHHWYPAEIRVIRNRVGVKSFGDAQSFRIGNRKLHVVRADAEIFHYGHVRHPRLMQKRIANTSVTYHGEAAAREMFRVQPPIYDFGNLSRFPIYTGTHPAVMRDRIRAMDWQSLLRFDGPPTINGKRERLKYRLLTFVEQRFLGGRRIGGYRNYVLLRNP